jgi:GH18 family chitinase
MNFGVGDIDSDSCTHVIYAFAGLDDEGRIVSLNPEIDITKGERYIG